MTTHIQRLKYLMITVYNSLTPINQTCTHAYALSVCVETSYLSICTNSIERFELQAIH